MYCNNENIEFVKKKIVSMIGALARIYATDGKAKEVAILAHAKIEVTNTDYDGRDEGYYGFTVNLEIPLHIYSQIKYEEEEIEKEFTEKITPLMKKCFSNCWIGHFAIVPPIPLDDPNWQEKAKRWLSGEGINNQGRVRSANIASKECDGLLFRSDEEILLYKALKAKDVSFAPLPVFVRGGKEYKRIEPDFIIIKNGIVLLVEVDGDTVHRESPAEAYDRTTMLEHEGAHIVHVSANRCKKIDQAKEYANELMAILEKLKSAK